MVKHIVDRLVLKVAPVEKGPYSAKLGHVIHDMKKSNRASCLVFTDCGAPNSCLTLKCK